MGWFTKFLNKAADSFPLSSIRGMIMMCEDLYQQFSDKKPGCDPHQYLVAVRGKILTMSGFKIRSEADEINLYVYTKMCACVAPPLCARALAFKMLIDDKNLSIEFIGSEYFKEYNEMMDPLFVASKEGRLNSIYNQYNKSPELQSLFAERG